MHQFHSKLCPCPRYTSFFQLRERIAFQLSKGFCDGLHRNGVYNVPFALSCAVFRNPEFDRHSFWCGIFRSRVWSIFYPLLLWQWGHVQGILTQSICPSFAYSDTFFCWNVSFTISLVNLQKFIKPELQIVYHAPLTTLIHH